MKKETILKRLEKAKVNKGSSAYKLLISWLTSEKNNIIRTCWTSGYGRFTTNLDYTDDLYNLLDVIRVRLRCRQ